MKIILSIIAGISVLYLVSNLDGGPPTPRISNASEFVSTLKLGENFHGMSDKVAKSTVSYEVLTEKVGSSKAEDLLEKHLAASTKAKQAEWNENLTDAYLRYFSPEELISIANERDSSPFAEKLEETRSKVGARMQNNSQQLLEETVAEALQNALEEIEQ